MNLQDKTSREQVLKNVRNAILTKTEMIFPDVDMEKDIYSYTDLDLDVLFAQNLIQCGGKFNYCATTEELIETLKLIFKEKNPKHYFAKSSKIKNLLETNSIPVQDDDFFLDKAEIGITGCEALVARLGSVVISSKQMSGRRLNFLPHTHIVIAKTNQIVYNVKDAIKMIGEKYQSKYPSMITTITGPSRTADIEKTLVMGAHGPKELIVIVIEQSF